jgi:parallel beta-helix repeat protein
VELDGAEVQANVIEGVIRQAATDGMVLRGARRNDIAVQIEECGGTGLALFGANRNIIRCDDFTDNKEEGMHLAGSSDNEIIAKRGPIFSDRVSRNQTGILIDGGSARNVFKNLNVDHNRENGVVLDGAGTSGNSFDQVDVLNSGQDGLRMQNKASDTTFGRIQAGPRNGTLQDNTNAAVRITGDGTRGFVLAGCSIDALLSTQPRGVVVENNAADVTISGCGFFGNDSAIIVKDGAHGVTVEGSTIGPSKEDGILVSNGSDVLIGSADPALRNSIYTNKNGIRLTGSAVKNCVLQNNSIYGNAIGILLEASADQNQIGPDNSLYSNGTGLDLESSSGNRIFGNSFLQHLGAAIYIAAGGSENMIIENQISGNNTGVFVTGAQTLRNSILNNSITANQGSGILLAAGGNRELAAPSFEEVQGNAIIGRSTAPDGSRVELFIDLGNEGEKLLTSGQVIDGRFRAPLESEPWKVGLLYNVNATVTDLDGNTSQFGALSPDLSDGHKVAFTSTRDGNSEVYLLASPSAIPANLTMNPAADYSPALASSCDEVLFVSDRAGNPDIFKVDAVTRGVAIPLTSHPAPDYDPAWLAPCASVVFVSERDGNPEIYSMDSEGGALTRLTSNDAVDRRPQPIDGGAHIIFESNRTGSFSLWKMNADGSEQALLFTDSLPATQGVVSPDGAFVAFISDRDGNSELYVSRLDGTGLTRLTHTPGLEKDPSWLPDSSGIVFASERSAGFELFVIPRAGGFAQPLTISTGDNSQPSLGH